MILHLYKKILDISYFYTPCPHNFKNCLNFKNYNLCSNFWLSLFLNNFIKQHLIIKLKKNIIITNVLFIQLIHILIYIENLKFILKFQFEICLSNYLTYANYKSYYYCFKDLFNFSLRKLFILKLNIKKKSLSAQNCTKFKNVFLSFILNIYQSFFLNKVIKFNSLNINNILCIQLNLCTHFYTYKVKFYDLIFRLNNYIFYKCKQIKTRINVICHFIKVKQLFNLLFQLYFKLFKCFIHHNFFMNKYFFFKLNKLNVYVLHVLKFKFLSLFYVILKKLHKLMFFYFLSHLQNKLITINFLSFDISIFVLKYNFFFKQMYLLTLLKFLKYKSIKIIFEYQNDEIRYTY